MKHSLSSIPEQEEEEADTSGGEVVRTPVRQGHREDTLTRVKSKPTPSAISHMAACVESGIHLVCVVRLWALLNFSLEGYSMNMEVNFPRSQVKLKKEIGKGDFGTVSIRYV